MAVLALPAAAAAHGADDVLASLPLETARSTCARTVAVDGLGDSCRTVDGLYRVELEHGGTISTHGPDPAGEAQLASNPHLSASQAAIDGASVDDIACVDDPADRRIELIYAHPSDRADRSAAITDAFRQAIYEASAFVDSEAQLLDPQAGRRIPVLCGEDGLPVVHVETMPALGVATASSFGDVVDALVDLGYPYPSANATSPRRFVIFYDAPNDDGAAGVAQLWPDDSADESNYNNQGARYAVEFDWSQQDRVPHWDILLHEMGHNMGAVADAAPGSSERGHCFDGLDIMCYDDGGSGAGGYSSTACPEERFDCNGDTYFNPSPTQGSWLASHWNVGSTTNAWLVPRQTGWNDGGVADLDPPTDPGTPTITANGTSLSVTWAASTDARSSASYRVLLDKSVSGSWVAQSTRYPVATASTSFTGLASSSTYRVRVRAVDQAGNESGEASAQAMTGVSTPVAPATITLEAYGDDGITATWSAASSQDTEDYDVQLQTEPSTSWLSLGSTAYTALTVTGVDSGTYRMRVRTTTTGGLLSSWRTSDALTLAGTNLYSVADAEVAITVAVRTATSLWVAWSTTPTITAWHVRATPVGGGSAVVRSGTAGSPIAVGGLRPSTKYTILLTLTSGDTDLTAVSATGTTAADGTAPSQVVLAGAPRIVSGRIRLAWRAASDDARVASYQVERRIAGRWRRTTLPASARATSIAVPRSVDRLAIRIRAVDSAGNAGRWTSRAVDVR